MSQRPSWEDIDVCHDVFKPDANIIEQFNQNFDDIHVAVKIGQEYAEWSYRAEEWMS